MKNLKHLGFLSATLVMLIAASSFSLSTGTINTKFHSQFVNVVVKGTSTIHDWDMVSGKGRCDLAFTLDAGDRPVALTELQFVIDAESIKSEHTTMDNYAYKAMKTKEHKTITFALASASITPLDAVTYQVKTIGNLSISGVTRRVDLVATAKYNADKSFTVSGSKKIKMTDYGVTPPSVMFGTIKTGNDLEIVFNTKIVKN
jgi:polyisoprenoid-binding protein YceI